MKPKSKSKPFEFDFPKKKKPKQDSKFDPLRKNKKAFLNTMKEYQ